MKTNPELDRLSAQLLDDVRWCEQEIISYGWHEQMVPFMKGRLEQAKIAYSHCVKPDSLRP